MNEKKPLRLVRWTWESWSAVLPFTLSKSAWSRGALRVLSSLSNIPHEGNVWRVSISKSRQPPSDEICREVLAEFGCDNFSENLNAESYTLEGFGRSAHARHFSGKVPLD